MIETQRVACNERRRVSGNPIVSGLRRFGRSPLPLFCREIGRNLRRNRRNARRRAASATSLT